MEWNQAQQRYPFSAPLLVQYSFLCVCRRAAFSSSSPERKLPKPARHPPPACRLGAPAHHQRCDKNNRENAPGGSTIANGHGRGTNVLFTIWFRELGKRAQTSHEEVGERRGSRRRSKTTATSFCSTPLLPGARACEGHRIQAAETSLTPSSAATLTTKKNIKQKRIVIFGGAPPPLPTTPASPFPLPCALAVLRRPLFFAVGAPAVR